MQTFGEILPEKTSDHPSSSHLTRKEISKKIEEYEKAMRQAAKELRFEDACQLRDSLRQYQSLQLLEEDPP